MITNAVYCELMSHGILSRPSCYITKEPYLNWRREYSWLCNHFNLISFPQKMPFVWCISTIDGLYPTSIECLIYIQASYKHRLSILQLKYASTISPFPSPSRKIVVCPLPTNELCRLFCKQYAPRSDFSLRSSLTKIQSIFYMVNIFVVHVNICNTSNKETTFPGQKEYCQVKGQFIFKSMILTNHILNWTETSIFLKLINP